MFLTFFKEGSRMVMADGANIGVVVVELILAAVLLALLFVVRKRFLRILFAAGVEICLYLACKLYFGEKNILTMVMCWVTAAVACAVTVAIVNRIDWSHLRGKRDL